MIKTLALLTLAAAASARKCTNITVPVSLASENAVFDFETPLTKIDVTSFAVNLARQDPPFVKQVQKGVSTMISYLQDKGLHTAVQEYHRLL